MSTEKETPWYHKAGVFKKDDADNITTEGAKEDKKEEVVVEDNNNDNNNGDGQNPDNNTNKPDTGGESVVTKFNGAKGKEGVTQKEEEKGEEQTGEGKDTSEGKVKLNLEEYLTSNIDTVKKYIEFKNTEFESLPSEKLLAIKLKDENPDWTDSEIADELADKYAIGLEKKVADEFADDEEKARIQEYNKKIDRANRLLKSDAKKALQYYNEVKANLSLPEFEAELNTLLPNYQNNVVENQEELLKQEEEAIRQANENWKKVIDTNIGEIPKVTHQVEIEDNEYGSIQLNIDYDFSADEAKQAKEYLYNYIANSVDEQRYIKEDGTIDMRGFLSSKVYSREVVDNLLKKAVADAYNQAKAQILKNVKNFDNGVKGNPSVSDNGPVTSLADLQRRAWKARV